jgi:hypothetical protein
MIFGLAALLAGCKTNPSNKEIDNAGLMNDTAVTIALSIDNSTWKNPGSLLKLDSYVILSSKVPVGVVKRVIIEDNIYILDKQSRLLCFKPNGEFNFLLNKKGKGPGEYTQIVDIAIDPEKGLLTIMDTWRRKLIHYSASTGEFIDEDNLLVTPHALAIFNNQYFFYNPYHYNYQNDKDLHYSLLTSQDGKTIKNRYLPHDLAIADYSFDDCYHQFFYNPGEIFFKKRFCDTIFSISNDAVKAKFIFLLPDALPYSWILEKPNGVEVSKSKYSWSLSDVYQCGQILFSTFFNQQYVISSFYDLANKKTIYCGRNIWPTPSKDLPVYSSIQGVKNNRFFSLVDASVIVEFKKANPSVFQEDWVAINENSNPVLVFYKIAN